MVYQRHRVHHRGLDLHGKRETIRPNGCGTLKTADQMTRLVSNGVAKPLPVYTKPKGTEHFLRTGV